MATVTATKDYPGHNVFAFADLGVTFSSNFDNGNLARVERAGNSVSSFKVWTALDNAGTEYQSKHGAWFNFSVTGLPMGCVLRIQVVNASNHSGLYKHDMVSKRNRVHSFFYSNLLLHSFALH